MNSNRKFDVSLVGTLLSDITNLNAFVLTPAVQICLVRALKEIKFSFSTSVNSTFSLLKVPNESFEGNLDSANQFNNSMTSLCQSSHP